MNSTSCVIIVCVIIICSDCALCYIAYLYLARQRNSVIFVVSSDLRSGDDQRAIDETKETCGTYFGQWVVPRERDYARDALVCHSRYCEPILLVHP